MTDLHAQLLRDIVAKMREPIVVPDNWKAPSSVDNGNLGSWYAAKHAEVNYEIGMYQGTLKSIAGDLERLTQLMLEDSTESDT